MPSNPREIGFRRGDFPELMGWSEVVAASERKDPSVRQMRNEMDDFPVPVQVLTISPVYLADEVRDFFKKYPRRTNVDADLIRQMHGLRIGGSSVAEIAQMLSVTERTVYNHLAGPET